MKKLFALSLIFSILLLPAFAADPEANGYIDSGGQTLQNGSTVLLDSKAEPVIGVSEQGDIKGEFGGIYTLFPGQQQGPVVQEVVDITIEHGDGDDDEQDDDIIVTWPNVPDGTVPEIVILVGDGTGLFHNDPAISVVDSFTAPNDYGKWIMFATKTITEVLGIQTIQNDDGQQTQLILLNMSGGQQGAEPYYSEMYIKVFAVAPAIGIDPPALTDYADVFIASTAVGKLDVDLLAGGLGYNYISVPLDNEDNAINKVFPPSMLDNETLIFNQMEGFDFNIAKLNNGVWVSAFGGGQDIGDNFYVLPQGAYMVRVPVNKLVTCVGEVLKGIEGDTLVVNSGAVPKDYTYFGNYYPMKFELNAVDVNQKLKLNNVAEGDRIFYADDLNFNFNIAKYKNGVWVSEFNQAQGSNIILKTPKGYMYKRNGGEFTWIR